MSKPVKSDDKKRIDNLENEVKEIKAVQTSNSSKLDLILASLTGKQPEVPIGRPHPPKGEPKPKAEPGPRSVILLYTAPDQFIRFTRVQNGAPYRTLPMLAQVLNRFNMLADGTDATGNQKRINVDVAQAIMQAYASSAVELGFEEVKIGHGDPGVNKFGAKTDTGWMYQVDVTRKEIAVFCAMNGEHPTKAFGRGSDPVNGAKSLDSLIEVVAKAETATYQKACDRLASLSYSFIQVPAAQTVAAQ